MTRPRHDADERTDHDHDDDDTDAVDLTRPDERLAHERARYLEATTSLGPTEADAVAYSELGYSTAAIARELGSTSSTVTTYLERAIAAYGPEAAHARSTPELTLEGDLSPVTEHDVRGWPAHYRDVWRDAVERHPERAADVATPEAGR